MEWKGCIPFPNHDDRLFNQQAISNPRPIFPRMASPFRKKFSLPHKNTRLQYAHGLTRGFCPLEDRGTGSFEFFPKALSPLPGG